MKTNTYICDNCEKRRDQDSNHWHVLFSLPVMVHRADVLSINPANLTEADLKAAFNTKRAVIGVTIAPWNEEVAKQENVRHVCGMECGFALLARRLSTGNFERGPVAVER